MAGSRRKITFAEIFTACYSSVFASAAVIDAIRKEDRRSDLDRQLEEARRELADVKQRRPGPDDMTIESSITNLTDSQMKELWRSLAGIYHGRPHFKEIHKPALLRESALRARLQDEHYRCLDAASVKLLRQTNLEHLERAILSEEDDPTIIRRDPHKSIHMRRYGDAIYSLIEALMARADSWQKDSKKSPAFDEVNRLLDEGYPRYTFRRIDPETAQRNTQQLNQANRSAIKDSKLGLREKIGRVCYNILVSAYPPDTQVFNALIAALDRHWEYRFYSESIISTFFFKTRLLPTPCTYPAILYHHRSTWNHGMFLRAIARIAGQDHRTGAKVSRWHAWEVAQQLALHRRAYDASRHTYGEECIWEHAPLNRLMVEEILRGLLQFRMFDHAVAFFTSCVNSGVQVTSQIVRLMLDECLVEMDWAGAVALVRELARHEGMWASMTALRDDSTVAYLVDRIYSLLDMIGFGETPRPASEKRLARLNVSQAQLSALKERVQATNQNLPAVLVVSPQRGPAWVDQAERDSRSRLLQIESLDKELIRVRKTTKSLESKLIKPDLAMEVRISMAEFIGGTALEASDALCRETCAILETYPESQAGKKDGTEKDMTSATSHEPVRGAVELSSGQQGTTTSGRAPPPKPPSVLPQGRYDSLLGAFTSRRSALGVQQHQQSIS